MNNLLWLFINMKKVYFLLTLFFLFTSHSKAHKYYVALTEIEFREKHQSIQMIMNVFIDDLELAINKDYNINLNLSTKKEDVKSDTYLYEYLKKHFKISINDVYKTYNFIGKEYEGNIVYFYLEIDNIQSVKTIKITNDLLINYFPDQQNLIKVKVNSQSKSLFLNKKNDKGLLNF